MQHHHKNDHRILEVADEPGQRRREQQHDDEKIPELVTKSEKNGTRYGVSQLVLAVPGQSFGHQGSAQAFSRNNPQRLRRVASVTEQVCQERGSIAMPKDNSEFADAEGDQTEADPDGREPGVSPSAFR